MAKSNMKAPQDMPVKTFIPDSQIAIDRGAEGDTIGKLEINPSFDMLKSIMFGGIGLVLLATPLLTSAQSVNEQITSLLALIRSLQAQIVALQAQSGGQSFCHNFYNDLTVGSSGDDIPALNQALSLSGINPTGNTSVFDENNAGDVVSFQAKYGIRQTGYVGPLTRGKLNALYGCRNNQQLTTNTAQTTTTQSTTPAPTATTETVYRCSNGTTVFGGASRCPTTPVPATIPANGTSNLTPDQIAVISPTGDTTFRVGQTITIMYAVGPNIVATDPAIVERSIVNANTGRMNSSYIPVSLSSGTYSFDWIPNEPGAYYALLKISHNNATYNVRSGGVISVVAPTVSTTQPSITVLNPNGGGYWYRGISASVEWRTAGIPVDSQMLIRLRSIETNQEYNLTTANNDGSESIYVPVNIPVGPYVLEIKTSVNGQSYVDASDSYFKVIDLSPPPLSVVNPAAPTLQRDWSEIAINVTQVSMPNIYVSYANMPPAGVEVVSQSTGNVIWRQELTNADGFSGSSVITLPEYYLANSSYYGYYVLRAFGAENKTYSKSLPFYLGGKG